MLNRLTCAEAFAQFKKDDGAGSGRTTDNEFVEIVTSVMLGRDWVMVDSVPPEYVNTEQCYEVLSRVQSVFSFGISLSNDLKNLYDALLSYHLGAYWQVKFVDKKEIDVLYRKCANNLVYGNEYVSVKEDEEVLLLHHMKERMFYVLDSNKVTGNHIRQFVDAVKRAREPLLKGV